MASSIAFDTHAFVKELTAAGMPEAQAEVLARSQARLINEELVTKRDLKEFESRLKHALTVRLGSMMVITVGVVVPLVKLLWPSAGAGRPHSPGISSSAAGPGPRTGG